MEAYVDQSFNCSLYIYSENFLKIYVDYGDSVFMKIYSDKDISFSKTYDTTNTYKIYASIEGEDMSVETYITGK